MIGTTKEILIAKFAHDRIIRPYFGDLLVVVFIYCFVKYLFDTPVFPMAIGVLLFSFAIESLQYLRLIDRLGLKDSKIASTIIGNSFEWFDRKWQGYRDYEKLKACL